jgi:hypothetical protein
MRGWREEREIREKRKKKKKYYQGIARETLSCLSLSLTDQAWLAWPAWPTLEIVKAGEVGLVSVDSPAPNGAIAYHQHWAPRYDAPTVQEVGYFSISFQSNEQDQNRLIQRIMTHRDINDE